MPLLIPALRCETAALHNIAITIFASANHRPALLCHSPTRQPNSKPCTTFADRSLRCQSMPMLCCPAPSCALPPQLAADQTVPNLSNSNPCRAGPPPYMETQFLALPLLIETARSLALASLCIASNAAAYRHKALQLHFSAIPSYSSAQLSNSSLCHRPSARSFASASHGPAKQITRASVCTGTSHRPRCCATGPDPGNSRNRAGPAARPH